MARTTRLAGGLNLALVVASTVIIAVVINVIFGSMRVRVDLSENQVNVLSDASRQAVADLEDLEIRLFISPDLPESIPLGPGGQERRIQGVAQKLRDKVEEYRAYGNNATVTEVTEDVVNEAEKLQIKSFTGEGASLSNGKLELAKYVLGVSFHYKNATEAFELALDPEYYEFEITKRLLRLKDKAESAITMKDVLSSGKELAEAAEVCTKALEAASGEGDDNPLALLNPETADAKLKVMKAAGPKIKDECAKMSAPLGKALGLERKNGQLDRMRVIGDALDKESAAFVTSLADAQADPGQLMQSHQRLVAIGKAMDDEKKELDDTPGRRRIGFVCNAVTFCPFPEDKPLIPEEMKGALAQQNPVLQQVLPVFERIQQEMNMVMQQVNQGLFKAPGFDIARIDLDEEVPDDVQAMVVFGAKSTFSDYQLYQLDQFVMRGGSLVVFLYPWDVKVQLMNARGEFDQSGSLSKNNSNIDDLIAHWGLKPSKKLVMDGTQNGELALYVQFLRQGDRLIPFQQAGLAYPALPSFSDFDTSDPLVRSTSSLTLPFTTSLELVTKPGVELVSLVRSSKNAVLIDDTGFPAYPPQAQEQALVGKAGEGPVTVAALARGDLESYFKGKGAPMKPTKGDKPEEPKKDDVPGKDRPRLDQGKGRVLVIGSNLGLLPLSNASIFEGFDLSMISGQGGGFEHFEKFRGYQVNYQNWSMRIGQVQDTLRSNLQFLQNVLDWSIQREALAELRSKQYAPRPLETLDDAGKGTVKALGLVLPAVLFLGLGGLWFLRRRARIRKLIAMARRQTA